MTIPVAQESSLELVEKSQPKPPLEFAGTSPSSSSQRIGPERQRVPRNNVGKAKKPLSFYMAFLALNICVLLVSLDATALSVAVPVSSIPPAIYIPRTYECPR